MSNLKCPFCQQGLQPTSIFDNRDKRCVWYCPNCATNKGLWVMANERVWQELIRTRKALDTAVDALDRMAVYDSLYDIIARNAMKRIKELEQKDGTDATNK